MTRPNRQARPGTHTDQIILRVEPELRAVIREASAARGMSVSGWLRDAAQTIARLQGIGTKTPRDAGTLHDRDVEGRQRWARIEGDQIKGIGYHDVKPDDGALYVPVVHEDSEPFNIATHWRLAPHYTLVDVYGTPDRVICTYPVVPKSAELA